MTAKGTVGVIGLGIMGGAFAQNLTAAGWRVIGYDLDAKRRRALAKAGIEIVDDATAVAAKATTIITSLPSPRALHDTVKAIIAAKAPGRVVIEASTFGSTTSSRPSALAKAGHTLLDCGERHRRTGTRQGHHHLRQR
jgi:3-hydroxyisobutyrate dehydrogenase-like beta-hydroxyacid dehydrogenase